MAAEPATQGVQTPVPSAADVPAAHGVAAMLPSQAWPPGHCEHLRLDDTFGAAVSYCCAVHCRISWQTRSLVLVGPWDVNCPAGHCERCVEQPRSVLVDGGDDSHSPCTHSVSCVQAAPSLSPDHVTPWVHGAHTRSDAAVPAVSWPGACSPRAASLC